MYRRILCRTARRWLLTWRCAQTSHSSFIAGNEKSPVYFPTATVEMSGHLYVAPRSHLYVPSQRCAGGFVEEDICDEKKEVPPTSVLLPIERCSTPVVRHAKIPAFGTIPASFRRIMGCRMEQLLVVKTALLRVQKRPRFFRERSKPAGGGQRWRLTVERSV